MVVPSSDSTDQLAIQTKDADSNEHSGLPLVHDFRSSSNKELTEPERGLVKDKIITVPLKENSALAKGSPSSQSIPEKNSKIFCRTGSCSEQDNCSSKNGQAAREFCSKEVTIEYTTNILEDHSFTEFMGVSDGKDFDGLTDSSAGEIPSRKNLPNKMDNRSVPDEPQDPGQLHSFAENDQGSRTSTAR
ncbi:kinesin family member 13A [Phyllostomus discolor]|nr:kinesin family member 13A [Phyllostomus discolor]